MSQPIRFTNLTRDTEIGANSYFIEIGGKRLIVDSGMHPKNDGSEALPDWGAIEGEEMDAILISHTHQDHIGTLPVLMRRQPSAKIFMTYATSRLGEALLHNSVNVMTSQREETGNTEYPLFTHRELDLGVHRWDAVPLNIPFGVDGERRQRTTDELTMEYFDAGHILGSAGIRLRAGGRTLFYTGDVNFKDQTLMRGAQFPSEGIDILVVETTRGDNPTGANADRATQEQQFIQGIADAFARGGSVLIPVFAIGKTQEVLTLIYEMKRDGRLAQSVQVYIGGLSTKMTMIHDELARSSPRQYEGLQLLDVVAPYVLGGKEAQHASPGQGKIFAISSGMMTEKTLSNFFARKFLEDERHSVFFVGYATPESPGGLLRAAQKGELVSLDKKQPPLRLSATVEKFDFSGHSTREELLEYILKVNAPTTVLVHGDGPAIEWFREQLAEKVPGMKVIVPPPGETLEL